MGRAVDLAADDDAAVVVGVAVGVGVDGTWRRGLLGVVGDFPINTIGEDRYGYQYLGTAAESGPIYRLYIP